MRSSPTGRWSAQGRSTIWPSPVSVRALDGVLVPAPTRLRANSGSGHPGESWRRPGGGRAHCWPVPLPQWSCRGSSAASAAVTVAICPGKQWNSTPAWASFAGFSTRPGPLRRHAELLGKARLADAGHLLNLPDVALACGKALTEYENAMGGGQRLLQRLDQFVFRPSCPYSASRLRYRAGTSL